MERRKSRFIIWSWTSFAFLIFNYSIFCRFFWNMHEISFLIKGMKLADMSREMKVHQMNILQFSTSQFDLFSIVYMHLFLKHSMCVQNFHYRCFEPSIGKWKKLDLLEWKCRKSHEYKKSLWKHVESTEFGFEMNFEIKIKIGKYKI